jgi:hypothetical protein
MVDLSAARRPWTELNLSRLPELMDFQGIAISAAVIGSRDNEHKQRWYELGHLAFSFVRRDRTVQRHDLLSFGQKRLLAFMYYSAGHG